MIIKEVVNYNKIKSKVNNYGSKNFCTTEYNKTSLKPPNKPATSQLSTVQKILLQSKVIESNQIMKENSIS